MRGPLNRTLPAAQQANVTDARVKVPAPLHRPIHPVSSFFRSRDPGDIACTSAGGSKQQAVHLYCLLPRVVME